MKYLNIFQQKARATLSQQYAATSNVLSVIVFYGFDTVSLPGNIFILSMKVMNSSTV